MKIIGYELKKLFSYRTFLFIAAACLFIVGFLEINHIQNTDAKPSDYGLLAEDIADMSYSESVEYIIGQLDLLFEGTSKYDGNVLYSSLQQLESLNGYNGYISSIDEQCDNITKFSIFADKNSFSYKNALKTKSAYEKIKTTDLPFDVSRGIENVLSNDISDILILFVLFSAAIFVFTKEKESGMINLLYSYSGGRSKLCINKLVLMIFTAILLVFLFLGELCIINGAYYGFGDLSRPIQSVNGFMECSYNINVLQYILLTFLFKCLGFAVWAILFSLICIFSSNGAQIYGISLLAAVSEKIVYDKISRVSAFGLLHDINLFSFIRPENVFASYRNLNIFGEPVNIIFVVSLTWPILTALITAGAIAVFVNGRNREYKKIAFFKKRKRKEYIHGRLFYALKKSLSLHGSLAIIVIWAVIVLVYHLSFSKPMDLKDFYYKQYTEQSQGAVTEETDELIRENELYFEELDNKKMNNQMTMSELNHYQSEQVKREALSRFSERVDKIRGDSKNEIFYDTGYVRAFSPDNNNEKNQLYLLIFVLCALTVSPIISYDKSRGLTSVIYSTASGKKSYLIRSVKLTALYSAAAVTVVVVPFYGNILLKYGTQGSALPIQSLTAFADSSLSLCIWQYAVILFLLRLFMAFAFSLVMLAVSYFSKSRFTAVLINITLFVLPLLVMNFIS